MTFPRLMRLMLRDLQRQMVRSGLLAVLTGIVALSFVAVAWLRIEPGRVVTLFGAVEVPAEWDRATAAKYIAFQAVDLATGSAGVLLTLVWTAGFVPTFVQPGVSAVMMAKPVNRSWLLAGHLIAVVSFGSFAAIALILAPMSALLLTHGVLFGELFVAWINFLLHFAPFYAFSALLGVYSRNVAGAVIGALLFYLTCLGINYGQLVIHGQELPELSASAVRLLDIMAWLLPRPVDLSSVWHNDLAFEGFYSRSPMIGNALDHGFLGRTMVPSVTTTAIFLALTLYEYETAEL